MTRRSTLVAVTVALFAAACAPRTSNRLLAMRYESGWKMSELDAEIARAGNRDVAVSELGRTAWVSEHIAVIRTEEKPHYHRFHDMTVVVLRGEGLMTVDQKQIAMRPGDVMHVHRGVPHFFRNTSGSSSAALVIFSPPFDGRDFVSEEEKKKPEDDEDEDRPKKKKRWWWPF